MKDYLYQLRAKITDFRPGTYKEAIRSSLPSTLEVLVILVIGLLFCKPYLNSSQQEVPIGREFLSALQMHHIWNDMKECGDCAFWYGGVAGGFPAFVDPQSSVLHPFVILGTLALGVLNGAKFALVATFIMVGIGHLWLGKILGLRRIVRVWGAGLAIASGHLAPRMDLGGFSLVLSMGTVTLIIPALINFANSRSRKSIAVLSIATALVIVSGNGYVQMGLAFCLPASIFLVPWNRRQLTDFFSSALIASVLALLIASPFLLPFGHFLPEFSKDFDIEFSSTQPFSYVPLNLVIRDIDFYLTDILGKPPWIAHFAFYVGWIPILLAAWGLIKARTELERRITLFLSSFAFLALWIASGIPFAWLVANIKIKEISELLAGVRYVSFISGLAIPPILGLAVIGLDQIFDSGENRLVLVFENSRQNPSRLLLDLRWILAIPLFAAISGAWTFNRQWIKTMPAESYIQPVFQALETPSLQWVNVPFGEHYFVEPALDKGLKLATDFWRTWHWRDRPRIEPLYEANRGDPPDQMTQILVLGDIHIHKAMIEREYAKIIHADGTSTPCIASGRGGHIQVECPESKGGTLIVQENNWSGWKAELDGSPVSLKEDIWLSVKAPPGKHKLALQYKPWDVQLSLFLFVVSLIVCVIFWVRPQTRQVQEYLDEEEA